MAFLSSLMQILRQSTERAVVHVRPPGPVKHGGAAPWKQHAARNSIASPHAQHFRTIACSADSVTAVKGSDRLPFNYLKAVLTDAITPVFKGIETNRQIVDESGWDMIRRIVRSVPKIESKSMISRRVPIKVPRQNPLSTERPRLSSVAQVGLRPNLGENF